MARTTGSALQSRGRESPVSGRGDVLRGRVALIGPPGARKSAHARLVVERFGVGRLSTGELLRAVAHGDGPVAAAVRFHFAAGTLVPDRFVTDVVRDHLRSLIATGRGAVLDGYPRTLAQAIVLQRLLLPEGLDAIIEIAVDREALLEQLLRRGRDSDTNRAIERRLWSYERNTPRMLGWLRRRRLVCTVPGVSFDEDARRDEDVHDDIVRCLAPLINEPTCTRSRSHAST